MKKREQPADISRMCGYTTCPECGFKLVPTCSGVESKCPRCGEKY